MTKQKEIKIAGSATSVNTGVAELFLCEKIKEKKALLINKTLIKK